MSLNWGSINFNYNKIWNTNLIHIYKKGLESIFNTLRNDFKCDYYNLNICKYNYYDNCNMNMGILYFYTRRMWEFQFAIWIMKVF